MEVLTSLRDALHDWTELDLAGFRLALCLGLTSPDTSLSGAAKHVFWTANPNGEMLHRMLLELGKAGVIKFDDEGYRVRWNSTFVGSWE